jgi:DNA-binding transcriptional MerR regulator
MSTGTAARSYTIKEAAALTGLPASTLRYYEQVGVIAPVSRGATSGHRVYDEADLDQLVAVSCLSATGMSLDDMRTYLANAQLGPAAAADQQALLQQQAQHLAAEAERLVLRRRYLDLKVAYWQAVIDGDPQRRDQVGAEASRLADELRETTNH